MGATLGAGTREELGPDTRSGRHPRHCGEPKEDEFGNRAIERRRPVIGREHVERRGPTPGCPTCHKQMLKVPLLVRKRGNGARASYKLFSNMFATQTSPYDVFARTPEALSETSPEAATKQQHGALLNNVQLAPFCNSPVPLLM